MFNEKLRNLREYQELSQADVSKKIGLQKSTYIRYETGASEPNFRTLKKLANFFDVSIDYLLENDRGCIETMETVDFETLILHGKYTIKSKFPTESERKMLHTIVNAIFENKQSIES